MIIDWILAQLQLTAPGLWLLLHLIAGTAILLYRRLAQPDWPAFLWQVHLVVIPYLGLVSGGLSPRLLGLGHIDWPLSLSLGAGILLASLALLVAVRASVDLSNLEHTQEGPNESAPQSESTTIPYGYWWRVSLLLIIYSGIDQFHWTFLRGSIWELLLNLPIPPQVPAYWAIWIAASLVVWEMLFRPLHFAARLVQVAALLTTGILFFYTKNFWMCWILHAATLLILTPRIIPAPTQHEHPHPML